MTDTKPVRAYATDLHLAILGTMDLNVDAVPARRSSPKPRFVTIHPNIDDPTPLPQVYWDQDTNSHFVLGEMHRAREVDGVLHRVSEEEITSIKTAGILPVGEATVVPFASTEVEATTQPGGTIYWLRLRVGKGKKVLDSQARIYALLADVLTDTTKAWVMEMTVRDEQKMFRLISWQGRLMLQELIRPGEFHEIDRVDFPYDGRLLNAVNEAAEIQTQTFNPDEFKNFYRDRAAALDEAKRNGTALPAAAVAPAVESDDEGLLALLTASVQDAKAKKVS